MKSEEGNTSVTLEISHLILADYLSFGLKVGANLSSLLTLWASLGERNEVVREEEILTV